jgi:hypothetical protein
MTVGSPHFFDASRFISASGEADGATVTFYYTGTSNLAPIYTDATMTTTLSNPLTIAVGAVVPTIFLSPLISYRRRIVFTSDGSVFDKDPVVGGSSTNSMNIGNFTALGTVTVPAGVVYITSNGYTTFGLGAGEYVNDALATSTLATSYPNLCKVSADGRYWRLLPVNGEITVDQAGALGDPEALGVINDGLAINQALGYAATVGIPTVVFPQGNYSCWHTARTTSFWNWGMDGSGMAIPAYLACKSITLKGSQRPHTRVRSFNKDGTELGSNWQIIPADGFPWRGHGLYVHAPTTDASACTFTGSISGTTLTVTSVASGKVKNNQTIDTSTSLGVTATAMTWSAGLLTITVPTMSRVPAAGEYIRLTSTLPVTFNGNFLISSATATSVVLVCPYNPGTYVSGGVLSAATLYGTTVSYQLTGTPGGVGTYLINQSQVLYSATVKGGSTFERNTICLENIWLDGGTTANGNLAWTNPPTDVPNGWDVSHKGIAFRPDYFMGDLILRNTKITGYRGELVYASNNRESGLILDGLVELGETNGQALNPAGGHVSCPGYVRAWNCNVMLEGWMGVGNIRGEFLNMFRGSTFTGGVIDTTQSGNGFKPQRPTDGRWPGISPMFTVDIKHSCHPNYLGTNQTISLGSFITGKLVVVDGGVNFAANEVSGPFKWGIIDTDVEVITVVDKATLQTSLGFAGSSIANSRTISNIRVKPEFRVTTNAIDNGFELIDGVSILGGSSIGQNVLIEQGCGKTRRGSAFSGTPAAPAAGDYYVTFKGNNFSAPTDFSVATQNVVTNPAIILRGDYMSLGGTAANSVTTVTLPSAGVQDRYEITLYNANSPSSNSYFALDRVATGVRLPARRLVGGADSIKLRYNASINLWQEIKPPLPVCYTTSVGGISALTLPAVGANSVSAVQTISNIYGAEVGMDIKLIPTAVNTAIELVNPQVTAANTISFRVREVNGAAYAGGTYNVTIIAEHRRSWTS